MSNSLIKNARTSKFENVCFCGHPNIYIYVYIHYTYVYIIYHIQTPTFSI